MIGPIDAAIEALVQEVYDDACRQAMHEVIFGREEPASESLRPLIEGRELE